jgi:hypothetical protein
MTVLTKLWRGLYSLPKAFWGFYICGLIGLVLLSGLFIFALRSVELHRVGFILRLCFLATYMFIASVGVWRSAEVGTTSPIWIFRFWAWAARFVVGINAFAVLWPLINGGALVLLDQITGGEDF